MPITFVGQGSNNGAMVALPAHKAGDLILVFAYQDSTSATPASGAGFTTAPGQVSAGNLQGHRVGWKFATQDNDTAGMWLDANNLIAHIYRGVDTANPIGGSANFTNLAAVTYPSINMAVADGTSWVVAFAGIRITSQPIETPPPGFTNRSNIINSNTGEAAGHDTAGGVSSYAGGTGGGNGFRYRTAVVELRAAPATYGTGAGSADGLGLATGRGAATAAAVASATGLGVGTATGAAIGSGKGTAPGLGDAQGVGASTRAGAGAATGTGQATGAGGGIVAAAGTAGGTSTVGGMSPGVTTIAGAGTASGSSSADAASALIRASAGQAAGGSPAVGAGQGITATAGLAAGTSTVQGAAAAIGSALGQAVGTGSALAVGDALGDTPDLVDEGELPAHSVFRVPARDTLYRVAARVRESKARGGRTMSQQWWKYPAERRKFRVDWTDELRGDTIITAPQPILSGTSASVLQSSNDDTSVTLWLSGGATGERGQVAITVTTAAGEILETFASLRVR